MNKYLFIFCLLSFSVNAQISFIKVHETGIELDEIASPIELPNGNFVCSIINHSAWYNVIYLFSRCGELITTLQVSSPDNYVFINNLFALSSGDILATGYSQDSTFNAVYLILDPNTLEVKKERKYFSRSFAGISKTVEINEIIFQVGGQLGPIASSMNLDFQRNMYLYRDFNAVEYPHFSSSRYIGYLPNRLYYLEGHGDPQADEPFSIIRCMDDKLRDEYILVARNDTAFGRIDPSVIILGGDTILFGLTMHDTLNKTFKKYIRKYFRDTIIYEHEVLDDDPFFEHGACHYDAGFIKCVFAQGEVSWFDNLGQRTFHSTTMANVPGMNLGGALISNDGGFFAFNMGRHGLEPVIRITKSTGDYEISLTPVPECIVSTDSPENESLVSVFPNPANGIFHVKSSDPVHQYQLYDLNGQLLMSEKVSTEEFDVRFDLMPGSYIISFETKLGWVTKKLFVIN